MRDISLKKKKGEKRDLRMKAIFPLVVLCLLTMTFAVPITYAPTTYGPRMDHLLIDVSYDVVAEWTKLKGGAIDVMDWPLLPSQIDEWKASPTLQNEIRLASVVDLGMMEFDLNCKRAPTDDPVFRRAIAYLVDKPSIILNILEGYGVILDVPLPPLLGEYLEPSVVGANYPYQYDPDMAETILTDAGYLPYTGEPLIFYARLDDPQRRDAGWMLKTELENLGIAVNWIEADRSVCFPKVMAEFDYHIYTGGWSLSSDIDYIHDLYSSEFYRPYWPNYNGYTSVEFDEWADKIKYAPNKAAATAAGKECQKIMIRDMPTIPLWSSVGKMAYRKGWDNVVNAAGVGPNNYYTWMCTDNAAPTVPSTIRYGFKSDIEGLNVVTSEWVWDHEVLTSAAIYDSLMGGDPYSLPIDFSSGMADSWEVTTWDDAGEEKSLIIFHMPTEGTIKWHPFQNGTLLSPNYVTVEDIKFSYQYVFDQEGWYYTSVMDIKQDPPGTLKIETPDSQTVKVYFDVKSFWALHWAGFFPILPKQIWEPVADAYAYDPEVEGTVVGCGPWKFVSRDVGVSIRLDAFRDYFLEADYVTEIKKEAFHRLGDVNYDDDVWLVDYAKVAQKYSFAAYIPAPDYIVSESEAWDPLTANKYPLTTTDSAAGGWLPEDIDCDGRVFIKDLAIVGKNWGKEAD